MSRDSAFTKSSEFREISDRDLYYDLGYKVATKDQSNVKTNSVILYLLIISGVMQLFFDISQFLTFLAIILYGIAHQYGGTFFDRNRKAVILVIVLFANVFDHIGQGLIIYPGSFTSNVLTFSAWIVEIIWILFFGVEFLSLYSPVLLPATEGRTVIPATEFTEETYQSLKERIEGSDFNVTDFKEEVDTSLLQISFRNQIQYLVGLFLVIVILDIFIWEIISIMSGGNNIDETYFVSGVSFIIYVLLIAFSGYFFRSENSKEKLS